MREQLSKVSGWIARPVAILALLIGVGATGAAVALAIDGGGGGDNPTRFQQLAERSGESDGDPGAEKGHKDQGSEQEHQDGDSGGGGDEFGGPGGFHESFPEGFAGIPEELRRLGEELESFRSCLEENGVEPPRGFGFGPGPGFHGFFGGEGGADTSFEPAHFGGQAGPGFGLGGDGSGFGPRGGERGEDFDFDALRKGFEACADQLPEMLQEPFNNRQDRFDERRQNRGAFEDCLREQGVGPGDQHRRGRLPDEADIDRLRGAFEQCRGELGGPFGDPDGDAGPTQQES
jgi:hypothetical protein